MKNLLAVYFQLFYNSFISIERRILPVRERNYDEKKKGMAPDFIREPNSVCGMYRRRG